MLSLLEDLPVELVGTNVFGYLSVKDIVMLERACASKKSHQAFMEQISQRPPVVLPSSKHYNISVLQWFANEQCKIDFLTIQLPGNNPGLDVKNLQVDYFDLQINSNITIESLKYLLENNVGCKVKVVSVGRDVNKDVMEQLSACTGNVKQLTIINSYNCKEWLTADILSRWKLKKIYVSNSELTKSVVILLGQTCTELTSIKLFSDNIDDAAVIAIAQHCPKLETLLLRSSNITWTSLLALSERGRPLEELNIGCIPNIPTVDISRCCSYALSCIRHLNTDDLYGNFQNASILPYMTRLTSLIAQFNSYIPFLTQHCHKLTKIEIYNNNFTVQVILSLCRANPLLQELWGCINMYITDTALIELIHACPHLHTLDLSFETALTDIGILALSEHCPQLQELSIYKCRKVTEATVLQLLQRCRKLTGLYVSSSSLAEETWTQLDKNTQKRVIRW